MMAESGWLTHCAACGSQGNVQAGCVFTTGLGHKFVYRLCGSCRRASEDEQAWPMAPDTWWIQQTEGRATGRIGKRIEWELGRFLEAGSPEPKGWPKS
ncbi:MAG TPA: hypothetical protein VEK07_09585 [Polyangiaceae bacterium]|nr:hypothetical protein [Polyangiaceae bacterium]